MCSASTLVYNSGGDGKRNSEIFDGGAKSSYISNSHLVSLVKGGAGVSRARRLVESSGG